MFEDYEPKNEYDIQGVEVKQDALNLRQELDLIDVFSNKDIDKEELVDMLDEKGIMGVISFLDKQDMIIPCFDIILKRDEEINIEEISADDSFDIVMDFFFNNRKLVRKFSRLVNEYVNAWMKQMEMAKKSADKSQKEN